MRITDVNVFPLDVYVFVKIETDVGVFGLGEASLSGHSAAVCEVVRKHLRPQLLGRDPTRIEHIWQEGFRGGFWRGGPVLQSALAGIDIALWDLNAKALDVPVYRLLGGRTRERVLLYRHANGGSAAECIQNAQQLLAEGWKVLRISPTDGIDPFDAGAATRACVNWFAALRDAIGDEVEVILEVHTRLNPAQATGLCRAIERFRPLFVEDPIRSESPAAYALLRRQTGVPLATGEQLTHKWAFRELIEQDLVDYLRVDLCHAGGITEGKKIAAMGEAHYQELALHMTGSMVSTAAMLHLNLAVPNCALQEYVPPSAWQSDVFGDGPGVRNGYLEPSTAPGLGLVFDEAAAARVPYREESLPRLYRHDGSVTDW